MYVTEDSREGLIDNKPGDQRQQDKLLQSNLILPRCKLDQLWSQRTVECASLSKSQWWFDSWRDRGGSSQPVHCGVPLLLWQGRAANYQLEHTGKPAQSAVNLARFHFAPAFSALGRVPKGWYCSSKSGGLPFFLTLCRRWLARAEWINLGVNKEESRSTRFLQALT